MTDQDPVDDENERDQKVFAEFIETLENLARPLGLYLMQAHGHRQPLEQLVVAGTDPVVRPFVSALFVLGEEAFSDRVQHPELYGDDAEIAKIEHATFESEAEEIMRRFAEEGKLFAEEDDE